MAARSPLPLLRFPLRRTFWPLRRRSLGLLLTGCCWVIAPALMPSAVPTVLSSAAAASVPPADLQSLVNGLDQAASDRDLDQVLAVYGDDFRTTDGLTRDGLKDALTGLWDQFETVTYRTEIKDWRRSRDEIQVETSTTLTATGQQMGRSATLTATVRSRQTLRNGLIVAQEILAERSQLSIGEQPPEVQAIAPEQVRPGDAFEFNAFVRSPLGRQVLAGAATIQATRPPLYGVPQEFQPVVLPGGGLFKRGQAGAAGDDRWLSAILVSGEGMTIVSQRLQVRR
ncbi:MAG: hypothetical protein Fur0042_21490 [Cyanophyceae cyanobacterium]